MTEHYHVHTLFMDHSGGESKFIVGHSRSSGAPDHATAFPISAIEWRAAEYNIDATTPEGKQQVIDILLHEPFMEPIHPAVLSKAHQKLPRHPSDPVHLWNAVSRDEAREHHLVRLANTKQRVNVVWSGNPIEPTGNDASVVALTDPLHLLITHPVDAQRLAEKSQVVIHHRRKLGLEPPLPKPAQQVHPHYDDAVRRRGLTVAIRDQ